MQNTAKGCECFKFWGTASQSISCLMLLVPAHQINKCSVFIPKYAKYILMIKILGVLFDGIDCRNSDKVNLVMQIYASSCLVNISELFFVSTNHCKILSLNMIYESYTSKFIPSKNPSLSSAWMEQMTIYS